LLFIDDVLEEMMANGVHYFQGLSLELSLVCALMSNKVEEALYKTS